MCLVSSAWRVEDVSKEAKALQPMIRTRRRATGALTLRQGRTTIATPQPITQPYTRTRRRATEEEGAVRQGRQTTRAARWRSHPTSGLAVIGWGVITYYPTSGLADARRRRRGRRRCGRYHTVPGFSVTCECNEEEINDVMSVMKRKLM